MTTYSVLIDNLIADITNNTEFAITLQVADVKDLNQYIRRTISTTIEIQGNEELDKLFFFLWSIKQTNSIIYDYDSLRAKECVILEDGTPKYKGSLILKGVKIIHDSNILYQFLFTTLEISKFAELGDTKLNQLTYFNIYDHNLTHTNIKDTWDGYNYIDGVRTYIYSSGPQGYGYLYPIGFYGDLTQTSDTGYESSITQYFNSTKLIPFFYVRELLLKSFEYIGLDADISSIDNDMFKSLMISGSEDTYKKNQSGLNISLISEANQSTSQTITKNDFHIVYSYPTYYADYRVDLFDVIDNITTNDNNALYNKQYTILHKGTLRTTATLKFDVSNNTGAQVDVVILIKINGINNGNITGYIIGDGTLVVNGAVELDVNVGDVISYELIVMNKKYWTDFNNFNIEIKNGSITIEDSYTTTSYGSNVNMVQWLPNMTIKEFLTGIFKLFHLYISEIKDNQITIAKYEDFYEDWSTQIRLDEHIDWTSPMEVLPTSVFLKASKYTIGYTQPDDEMNKNYKDLTGKYWGSSTLNISNDKNLKAIDDKVPFSLVIPNQIDYSALIIPTVYKWDNNKHSHIKFAPMLAFNLGVMDEDVYLMDKSGSSWITTYDIKYPFISNSYKSISGANDLNLCMEYPAYVYYDLTTYPLETIKTIYEKFFYNDYNDLYNSEGKVVIGEISPKAWDGKEDILRKIYTIDGVPFRVNKIEDFNKNLKSIKVELIKKLTPTRKQALQPPVIISTHINHDSQTMLKSGNYNLESGISGMTSNELWVDQTKKIIGINGNPLLLGNRHELIGKISQGFFGAPVISPSLQSMSTPLTERVDEGEYRIYVTEAILIIPKTYSTQPLDIVRSLNYYTIYTNTDGVLNENLIYILKITKE